MRFILPPEGGRESTSTHRLGRLPKRRQGDNGKRVEAVSSDGGGVKFRLVLADQTLEFQAASVAARLEWMSQLEAHLGMQVTRRRDTSVLWRRGAHTPFPPAAHSKAAF